MSEEARIPKWEYRHDYLSKIDLNELGQKGWELCGFSGSDYSLILKRQAGWIRVTERTHEPEQSNDYQQYNGYSRSAKLNNDGSFLPGPPLLF